MSCMCKAHQVPEGAARRHHRSACQSSAGGTKDGASSSFSDLLDGRIYIWSCPFTATDLGSLRQAHHFDVKPIYEYLAVTDFVGKCYINGRAQCGCRRDRGTTVERQKRCLGWKSGSDW